MSAQKLSDSNSSAQPTYYQRQGGSQFIKFSENTACKLLFFPFQLTASTFNGLITFLLIIHRPQLNRECLEQAGLGGPVGPPQRGQPGDPALDAEVPV